MAKREMAVMPGEVLFAPARAAARAGGTKVRYGDRMIIRAGGGGDAEAAVRTPFGPVSVEED